MPTWVDKILNSQSVQFALAALAFLIALWLVIVIARMLMGGRLRLPGGRQRQARLGIVDAFDLDRQRQLIIVRRDNTEHLIMIGGPNDLLIESEIVRVEARDMRDMRRDKGSDLASDARIPAPIVAPGSDIASNGAQPYPDEPMLPMALPQASPPEGMTSQAAEIAPTVLPAEPAAPARAPTFPLPPRRPVPSPTAERRPPPLPERVSRTDEPAATGPSMVGPSMGSAVPTGYPLSQAPASAPGAAMPGAAMPVPPPAPASTPDAPQPPRAPVRPVPPPFLKPLPPRPPVRPLKRATPQVEPILGAPADATAAGSPSVPLPSSPAGRPTPAQPSAPKLSDADDKDALESLEEEMAKLLGR